MKYLITVTNDGSDGLLLAKSVDEGDLRSELDSVFKSYDFKMVRVWQECGMDFYRDRALTERPTTPGQAPDTDHCPGGNHPFHPGPSGHCRTCGHG